MPLLEERSPAHFDGDHFAGEHCACHDHWAGRDRRKAGQWGGGPSDDGTSRTGRLQVIPITLGRQASRRL
jgi:hypothetical protein